MRCSRSTKTNRVLGREPGKALLMALVLIGGLVASLVGPTAAPALAADSTLFADDFGSGSDINDVTTWNVVGYADWDVDSDGSGTDAALRSTASWPGPYPRYLRLRSGGYVTKANIDTTGLTNIRLQYSWGQDTDWDLSDDGDLVVQWKLSSAVTWTTLNTHDLANNSTTAPNANSVNVTLGVSAENTSIDIRFWGNTGEDSDQARVDNVVVLGECTDTDGDGYGRGIGCVPTDCDDTDDTVYPGAPELCDNKDNDCDQSTDEGLTESCGTGACAGTRSCTAGVWSDCSTWNSDCGTCGTCDSTGTCIYDATQDADCPFCQECSGLDACTNQSNGSDVNNECDADDCMPGYCDGAGACAMAAFCTDCGICAHCDGTGFCVYDETQDSDCNATVCPADGCGVGTCPANIWGDYPASVPNECAGLDTCTQNSCTATCEPDDDTDGWSPTCGDCNNNDGTIHPGAAEICDGKDNDCDTVVDEGCQCITGNTQACYPGPAGTQGVGVCKAGTQTCNGQGQWGPCLGAVVPTTEISDGLDNDCDGLIDEGFQRVVEFVPEWGSVALLASALAPLAGYGYARMRRRH